MADWTAALLDAAGAAKAWLVGHSMGSLIALETAARHPAQVSTLSLIGTAAAMTVGPDLLKAAEANDHSAIDMVSIWGLGFQAELGGSLAPGLWMHSGAQRVLERCKPGVLFNDLNACNAYQNALAAAAQVTVPCTLVLGERDMMTPAKAGKALASAVPNSRTVVIPGAGHMMMVERPDELLAARRGLLSDPRATDPRSATIKGLRASVASGRKVGRPDLDPVGMKRPVAERLALAEFPFCELHCIGLIRSVDLEGTLTDFDLPAVFAKHVLHEMNDKP